MTKITIKTGTEEDFFARGLEVARAADRGESIPEHLIISFEDPEDLFKVFTPARLALIRAVKFKPGSITDLAVRLHRDRSAVKRDLDALEVAGLVSIADKALPGHGRMKEVRTTAARFSLQADVA